MSADNLTNLAIARRAEPEEMARELRQWAIERAIQCNREPQGNRVVAMAGAFVDFVTGTNDAEVVRAARELAEKVTERS